jgi:hypothetical protein
VGGVCGATDAGTISFHTTKLLSPAAIENSLQKLANLVSSFDTSRFERAQHDDTITNSGGGSSAPAAAGADKVTLQQMKTAWRESLDDTQWLKGVRLLLETTSEIVNLIIDGEPVLVQSADGGDAVPQVVSLAQVCLDPYFRTTAGFCFLIEKEWMACGTRPVFNLRERRQLCLNSLIVLRVACVDSAQVGPAAEGQVPAEAVLAHVCAVHRRRYLITSWHSRLPTRL